MTAPTLDSIPDLFTGSALAREIPTPHGAPFRLEYNEKRAANRHYENATECPLCQRLDQRQPTDLDYSEYRLIHNNYPFAPKHILAVTRHHHPDPQPCDLAFAQKLARKTQRVGTLSLKGSGAGIPQHLHFQFFQHDLPIFHAPTRPLASTLDVTASRVEYPACAIQFEGPLAAEWTHHVATQLGYPFNLVLTPERIILFPRAQVYPIPGVDYRIGATELSGWFIVKIRDLYDTLDREAMERIMKDATADPQEVENRTRAILGQRDKTP